MFNQDLKKLHWKKTRDFNSFILCFVVQTGYWLKQRQNRCIQTSLGDVTNKGKVSYTISWSYRAYSKAIKLTAKWKLPFPCKTASFPPKILASFTTVTLLITKTGCILGLPGNATSSANVNAMHCHVLFKVRFTSAFYRQNLAFL